MWRDGDGSNRFQIDEKTGEVISTASFLGQAGASFELLVKATDQDGKGLSSTKILLVSANSKFSPYLDPDFLLISV